MKNLANSRALDGLEPGFVAAPLSAAETAAAAALCVIVRTEPDPVAGHFVMLRSFSQGRVLLGALRDRAGRILAWQEIWIPTGGLTGESATETNAARDAMWKELDQALFEVDPFSYFAAESPDAPRRPVFIDVRAAAPWHPAHADQGPLELCTDDASLLAAGLPPYSSSAARFAWVPGQSDSFTALNEQAAAAGRPGLSFPGDGARLSPLNPEGWPLIVRSFAPVGIADFAALLGGVPWRGDDSAVKPCRLNRDLLTLADVAQMRCGGRHFFSGREGAAGLVPETLFLKLQLALQAMEAVRDYIEFRQLPMLNLTAESFRVRLGSGASQLPILWTAEAVLAMPGDSIAMTVPGTQERYFKPATPLRESIYWPEELTRPRAGVAKARIRNVVKVTDGLVVEATLSTPEELRVEVNELIALRLPLADGVVPLMGYLDSKVAMARGEAAFRSVPLLLGDGQSQALSAAVGVIFTHVPIEIQVPLSSPCDLYSLGVLALQIIFAGGSVSLAESKDALFSLAAHLKSSAGPNEDMPTAIRRLFNEDERWMGRLGPHLMMTSEMGAAEAPDLVPIELWSQVLATLLRLFPGRSPFAFCQDFGDAPPLALHVVLDRGIEAIDALLRVCRSMHLMDWKQNREIASTLERWLQTS